MKAIGNEEKYGYAITRTSRAVLRFLTGYLRSYAITPEQWTVVKRVYEHDGITQKELAAISDKDPATLAKILDILEREGLIVRKTNKEDRRSYLIYITDQGVKLRDEVYEHLEQVFSKVLDGIPQDELAVFNKVLGQIEDNAAAHTVHF
ncbi:MarR family transcriptional regulator [Paenibacillus urinalis]|uniref:MarR family transcriptional regulator n=1 Tax=Paenibacillus urinalis TaxID=521520 RepID=A0AAX3N547_9BACL|nr:MULTISPECIES: MarR family transcriptional regulator [Paenibacillus]WDH84830.1 MarR family transcriptional regulator [Paenibacillus urinalis]WDH96289.1 MarR family transcriptional regulator [Paenibacillus urinalis]WDI04512.1 MarR family transcriptional regulator [Paenibacillus urinalis]